jgi:hypothetical protein
MNFAFKIARMLPAGPERDWSTLIAMASKSVYSHVEIWLNGEQNNAYCFSSREPHGAGFQTIDLTSPWWEIVPITATFEEEKLIWGYCLGADGKGYDAVGLLGFGKDPAVHDFRDLHCSETGSNVLTKCLSKTTPKLPWMMAPGDLCTFAKGLLPKK